jgi:6-phosphogluconolactonase
MEETDQHQAKLFIAPTKAAIGTTLSNLIIQSCHKALQHSNIFTIALSGGSLPTFLQGLPAAFTAANIDPQWTKWHVLLADERCVLSSHTDSNLGSIRTYFTNSVGIPSSQIYGIDETLLLGSSSEDVASSYEENVVKYLLNKSNKSTDDNDDNGKIDCVLLGFGPDGHTCSLFPNHKLLNEQTRLVASIDDSPKPPSSRITLTLPFLNQYCRQIIFCGAGESKRPILQAVFRNVEEASKNAVKYDDDDDSVVNGVKVASVQLTNPAPYPCGMVRPQQVNDDSLFWLVDQDACI